MWSIDWSLLVVAITFVLMVTALVMQRKELNALRAELKDNVQSVHKEMKGVSSASIGVGKRLLQFDAEFRNFITKVDEMMRDDPSRVSYTEASRLVGLGAEIEDLVASCGLSKPEAQLVQAVYGKAKKASVRVSV